MTSSVEMIENNSYSLCNMKENCYICYLKSRLTQDEKNGLQLGTLNLPCRQGYFELSGDIYKLNIIENMFLIFNKCLFLLAHTIAVFFANRTRFPRIRYMCTCFSDHKEICSYR